MTALIPARFPQDRVVVEELFREYQQSLGIDLAFQAFEKEIAALPGKYAPPQGNILLAMMGEKVAGCVCWYELESGICEVKRLYVRPNFRGQKLGRRLLGHAIESARQYGYRKLRLDSLERLREARKLYENFDFKSIAPYNQNPHPDVYYLELDLKETQ